MKQLDPARHVAPMTAETIIADQQLEIAGLKEQLRLEKEWRKAIAGKIEREYHTLCRTANVRPLTANGILIKQAMLRLGAP